MITAKEAQELASQSTFGHLNYIEGEIRKAAKLRKRSLLVYVEPYARWLLHDKPTDEAVKVLKILEDNGFRVSQYHKRYPISSSVALRIEW